MTTSNRNTISILDLVSPKRILVATDMTDGDYLIPHAVAQAKASGAMVTLVHAILPLELIPMDGSSIAYVDWEKNEADIEAEMLAMAEKIEAAGVSCDVVAKRGVAVDVLREEIEATHATRLIMASHGRGRLGQFMMGSVAHQILGSVNIPVFVVGPKSAGFPQHATPRRILHPVSLNGDYRSGIELAIALAQKFGAELTLLHVPDREVESRIQPGCMLSWAENLYAKLLPNLPAKETVIQVDVAVGNLVDEIRKAADRIGADWIVLGAEEDSTRWPILESTAYKVLASANCPVFAFQGEPYAYQREAEDQANSLPALAYSESTIDVPYAETLKY